MTDVIVILGNQLVPGHPALRKHPDATVVMIEADDVCRAHRYHQHKLILVLAAMRHYAAGLTRDVDYTTYEPGSTFRSVLADRLAAHGATRLIWMQTSDRGPNELFRELAGEVGCETVVYPNAQFLTTPEEFASWVGDTKSPLMENFYRWQRKRLDILMDGTSPEGGRWNYDDENRHPLPKQRPAIPPLPGVRATQHVTEVAALVAEHFADHPGRSDNFWLPTTRTQALRWLDAFIDERLESFGRYEDAMAADEPFLFHSVLSPLINLGLLLPGECVEAAIEAYHARDLPLSSVEGFVRQVIGWREFMFGLYWTRGAAFNRNFFDFRKPLEDWWFTNHDVPQDLPVPLRVCLDRVHEYGYSHHIERLLVFGNWFLTSGYQPRAVYEWFMSMYVDAYEWVMVPNVLGMSQYADGGMLATKPYIAGGNYLQKMGNWFGSAKEAKDSEFTSRYWQFLADNDDKLSGNHRLALVLKQARARARGSG
ncbi:cryptochrome/photolyase family protein [Branchiibius sp. NY16-3462-2]|uniref:cryptochrome/photolyase family protein n=1 Tax=Branchiibius sp. NY16-3462-2 TaxID=1807500 RepID=UPI0007940765|nr:cryptochrome/photolyase family protein [Branchiibius sp. NY16-3462-2]KYH43592.1 hypothetical protein AZH51_03810 [Branchiibius sp. NY16-3462-2]